MDGPLHVVIGPPMSCGFIDGGASADNGRSQRDRNRDILTTMTTWDELRRTEKEEPYWRELERFLAKERSEGQVLPEEDRVFAALEATPFDKVKVVILGQDPYPTPGHAHGLAFSVPPGVEPLPPSLRNILDKLSEDLGVPRPTTGCLESWAEQGVLLLNTTLTVRPGARNSHARAGWSRFSAAVVSALGARTEPMVFILWGAH